MYCTCTLSLEEFASSIPLGLTVVWSSSTLLVCVQVSLVVVWLEKHCERMERISARQLLNKEIHTPLMVYNHWTGRLMNWTTGPTVFHSLVAESLSFFTTLALGHDGNKDFKM